MLLGGDYNKMTMFIVILLMASACVMLQSCDAAPWLLGDNTSSLTPACHTDDDCQLIGWEAPYPVCDSGVCRCSGTNTCRQRTIAENWESYAYFCGQCGEMGSACTFDRECPYPFPNCYDGYCRCFEGNIFRGICRVDEIMGSASTTNLVLCCVLLLLVIVNKMVSSARGRRMIHRAMSRCCCRRRDNIPGSPHVGEDGVYHNPRSSEKSASYTIANSDFITSTDDPDLEWAIELSRQLAQGGNSSRSSSTTNSIRSRTSNRSRNSTRSRASNTSRRSGVGTDTMRRVARNVAKTPPSAESRGTIDEVNLTIIDTDSTTTSGKNASGNSQIMSTKIGSDKEDKPNAAVRNVDENKQTTSTRDETSPFNAKMNSIQTILTQTDNESKDPQTESSGILKNTERCQLSAASTSECSLTDALQTQESRSNKLPGDGSDSEEPASNSRGNKVAGRGKMIILVPRKTYSVNPSRSSSQR